MAFKKLIYQAFIWRSLNYASVFLLNIFTARLLGASLSGEIYFIVTFFSLIVLFASLNLESSLAYFSLSKEINTTALASIAVSWTLIGTLIFFFSVELIIPLASLPSQAYEPGSAILFIVGMLLTAYYTSLFYGQKNFSFPNIISFLCNFSVLFFLLYNYLSGNKISSSAYLRFYFIASFIQGIIILVFFHWKYIQSFYFQLLPSEQLKKIIRYSFFTFFTSIFLFLLYRIDYWLLLHLNQSTDSKAELGNYIQVSKLIFSFQVFSSMLGTGVFSGTVSNNTLKQDKTLGLLIRSMFYIGLIVFLLLIILGKSLFTWVYGETFKLMYDCFLLILPGSVFLMTVSVTANYLSGIGKVKYNLYAVSISMFFIIILDLVFIPAYGIYAAAAISGIAYSIYGLIMLFHFSRHYGGGWKNILNYRNDLAQFRSLIIKTSAK